MSHDGIKDGIAQELQPLVVLRTTLFVPLANTLVQQSLLVKLDVVGIETQNLVESRKKLLLLSEREPYSINNVNIVHSSLMN